MLNREETQTLLRRALWEQHNSEPRYREFKWQVQGFGMLRTYLPGEGEPRLQIWDQRLAVWGNGAIHDHPWDFRSRIIAGTLFNQRFERRGARRLDGETYEQYQQYNQLQIKPGEEGGPLEEEPTLVWLAPQPVEVYSHTEEYTQKAHELHLTRYLQGTVTMIERNRVSEADTAFSLWKDGPHWSFFRPREATPHEINAVLTNCLETWWLR